MTDADMLAVTTVAFNFTTELLNASVIPEQVGNVGPESIIVAIVWGILVIIGIIGNGLVIFILSRYGEKSVTNIYVVNLAVSDLMFIVLVLPITAIHFVIPSWMFGEVLCRIFIYVIFVTLYATCLTLMAMTIDRYYSIVHPIQSMNWRTAKISTIVCLVAWSASFLISLPYVLYTTLDTSEASIVCTQVWPTDATKKGVAVGMVVTSYILPLTVICACYGRILQFLWRGSKLKKLQKNEDCNGVTVPLKSATQIRRKKRVTRMVAIVVLLFAICWLPAHAIHIWIALDENNFPYTSVMFGVKIVAHTISYANSCVNPFVYAFLNDGFRKAFRKKCPVISSWFSCFFRNPKGYQETSMIDKAVEARPGMEHSELLTSTQTTTCAM